MPEPVEHESGEWSRRKRLAEVFGDTLPDTTSDERDPDEARPAPTDEDWLRAQVPPHHGQVG